MPRKEKLCGDCIKCPPARPKEDFDCRYANGGKPGVTGVQGLAENCPNYVPSAETRQAEALEQLVMLLDASTVSLEVREPCPKCGFKWQD